MIARSDLQVETPGIIGHTAVTVVHVPTGMRVTVKHLKDADKNLKLAIAMIDSALLRVTVKNPSPVWGPAGSASFLDCVAQNACKVSTETVRATK